MPKFRTPGIYVQEIPVLPAEVAEVGSAIPAFIGYTYSTKFNGNELKMNPIKIHSMIDFMRFYGDLSPFQIQNVNIDLDLTVQYVNVDRRFYLYDALQLYFVNGGGPCYIVSIGTFRDAADSALPYLQGLDALDSFDEPTLYIFPDAVSLADDVLANVQQYALRKCAELKDRFTILDIKQNNCESNALDAVAKFRNNIGMTYLNYGAVYTPWLTIALDRNISASSITGIFNILNSLPNSLLDSEVKGRRIRDSIAIYEDLLNDLADIAANAQFLDLVSIFENSIEDYSNDVYIQNPFVSGQVFNAVLSYNPNSSYVQDFWGTNVIAVLANWETQYTTVSNVGTDEERAVTRTNFLLRVLNSLEFERFSDLNKFTTEGLRKIINSFEEMFVDHIPYYRRLLGVLDNMNFEIPPSGAMAGLYCKIDHSRGVWKAPANISISSINGVTQLFSSADLANLNVDPVAGKSVNVIRPITGHGIMVMGARTLAGNDSEWRYIPVRRLMIFIEENLKQAISWVIHEPNNRLLWLKVKTQIENYLYNLWRKGALAGSKPEDAYGVICGLNSTMTAQEVLDGKLIIEIRLAPIRPAEFIVLKIFNQLQVSS